MTPQPPETANRRDVGAAHEFVCSDCARVYMTSMAPKTPTTARPAASMPMRAALPSELPAALVGEVPAFPLLVGPAVPAVVRTVPLFASVA
jgi:hypothetical protein